MRGIIEFLRFDQFFVRCFNDIIEFLDSSSATTSIIFFAFIILGNVFRCQLGDFFGG